MKKENNNNNKKPTQQENQQMGWFKSMVLLTPNVTAFTWSLPKSLWFCFQFAKSPALFRPM